MNLRDYNSDKIPFGLFNVYEQYFEKVRYQPITLLELGILNGESLRLWRDYFPLGRVIGIDIRLPRQFKDDERITLIQAKQSDGQILRRAVEEFATEGLDIVVDDASHIGLLTKTSFELLFPYLKPGGFYAIEDWQTGYWSEWPDGKNMNQSESLAAKLWRLIVVCSYRNYLRRIPVKIPLPSHSYGMVGLLKKLIDEMQVECRGTNQSPFERMIVHPRVVLIEKRWENGLKRHQELRNENGIELVA